jgi:Sec-independent protein translocase protein TatA
MPSVLFILLLALVVFGPRRLPEIAAKILRAKRPWEQLMGLITESVSPDGQGSVSTSRSSAEPAIAPIGPSSSLAKSESGD